jgi:hypothetical protein
VCTPRPAIKVNDMLSPEPIPRTNPSQPPRLTMANPLLIDVLALLTKLGERRHAGELTPEEYAIRRGELGRSLATG